MRYILQRKVTRAECPWLDRAAERWAEHDGIPIEHFPKEDYDTPLKRNLAMLDTLDEHDLVIAFKDSFGTREWPSGVKKGGTEHAVRHAKLRNIPVWLISHAD